MKSTSNKIAWVVSAIALFFLFQSNTAVSQSLKIQGGNSSSNATDISPYINTVPLEFLEVSGFITARANSLPDCWMNSGIETWLSFKAPESDWYTFTTNIGTNAFLENNRIALYKSNNVGLSELLACNEYTVYPCIELETSGYSIKLEKDQEYHIRLGKNSGSFDIMGLMIYPMSRPDNDCILNALNIQNSYEQISDKPFVSAGWHSYRPLDYNTPFGQNAISHVQASATKLYSSLANDTDENICKSLNQVQFKDVWFTFSYNKNLDALLNVYDIRDQGNFGIQVFRKNGEFSWNVCQSKLLTSGLERLGCSAPDGQFANSEGDEDWAKGDFISHARINLSELGLLNNDEIYLRVYALENEVPNLCAEAFQLVFEQTKSTNSYLGMDGMSADNAKVSMVNPLNMNNSGKDFYGYYNKLANSGMRGGLNTTNGSTSMIVSRENEISNNIGHKLVSNCQEEYSEPIETLLFSNNNSAVYSFYVENLIQYGPFDWDTINRELLLDSNWITSFPLNQLTELSNCMGLTVDSLHTILLNDSLDINLFELCDSIVTTCGADVTLTLSNIGFCGVPGNTIELVVLPNITDTTSENRLEDIPMFIGIPNYVCSTEGSFSITLPYLPSGAYSIVVDGESGNLASYDLELDISYVIPGTDIPCGSNNAMQRIMDPEPEINSLNSRGLEIKVSPMPLQANGTLEIISDDEAFYNVLVRNANGMIVLQRNVELLKGRNELEINLGSQPSGMYILEVSNDKNMEMIKLLKY